MIAKILVYRIRARTTSTEELVLCKKRDPGQSKISSSRRRSRTTKFHVLAWFTIYVYVPRHRSLLRLLSFPFLLLSYVCLLKVSIHSRTLLTHKVRSSWFCLARHSIVPSVHPSVCRSIWSFVQSWSSRTFDRSSLACNHSTLLCVYRVFHPIPTSIRT